MEDFLNPSAMEGNAKDSFALLRQSMPMHYLGGIV